MPLQASSLLRTTTRSGELIGRHLPLPKQLKQTVKQALIALAFVRADGAIASYPKSGRTWLRFILANYFDLLFDLGLAIDLHSMFQVIPNDQLDDLRGRRAWRFERRPELPLLFASHAPYRRSLFAGKKVLLMLREPKDLMVSAYFHKARQGGYADGIKAFLRDPAHGLADYVRYSNRWAERLGAHRHLTISYERLAADTEGVVLGVLDLFEVEVDPAALGEAIERSRFERMRAIEIAKGLPGHRHDGGQAGGLRVRKGKIGGFRDDLDEDDVAFVDQGCRAGLSPAAQQLLAGAGLALA
jgi:alcohol sulfotransferase